jgi:hypothetical protein
MTRKKSQQVQNIAAGYNALLSGVVKLLEDAPHTTSRAVNAVLTKTYWEVGRRIVEHEQQGLRRAGYGEQVLDLLAKDLEARFGRGLSRANVAQMRQFYIVYPKKIQTVSGQLGGIAF